MAATSNLVRALHMSTRFSSSILPKSIQRQSVVARCRYSVSSKPTDQAETEQTESQKDSVPSKDEQLSAEVKKLEQDVKDVKKPEAGLEDQIVLLKEELNGVQDKYVRALAETENVRKRMAKQVADAKAFGIQGFCKDMLEVSDILSAAITTVPKEELTNSNPHLMNLFQGLNMTESQLMKVFKKHGLESISPSEGEKFDPHIHEAMFQVPIQAKETQVTDTVAVVQKVGFKLHDRTVRPAQVGVFKG